MDHGEALQMMAAERYLLNELTPKERDAFELHMFGCQECALDIRAGSAFINEAKSQLAHISTEPSGPVTSIAAPKRKRAPLAWLWQPSFALPAFAVMLGIIAYQNFSAIPSMRRASSAPRLAYSSPIHTGTRGSAHTAVQADRKDGFALSIELPQSSNYSAFVFELYDPTGKKIWTQTLSRPNTDLDGAVSLIVPGSGLQQATYTLSIWATTPENNRVEIDRRALDVQFEN
ncbi:MAG TPA: zf-HC2 domain-containing protein [Terracidiphilus sp.]|nr:zf-HC2 domain-containing protein [Terracidiphilus sp.]